MTKKHVKSTVLCCAFLLPAAVMAAVFALCGLAPFGTRTLGVIDMSHQYLPFLYSLRDILAGRADMSYLPSMCLGGNMFGAAAYYLMSPLNLITCLFPREHMYDAVSIVYLLRVGLCGLTMCIYTGRRHGYGARCLVPAAAYALMAYMVAYSFNYLWQDCVILLPIVALGLARLTEGGRPWLYILSLAASLALNFYIGYILCIFSVLFFLYELLSVPRAERAHPWRTLGVFALSSLAAGALAAVVLLPAFSALSGGKAEFSLSVLTLALRFDPVSMLAKLYPGAFRYEQIMPEGLPQIFTGTVTVTLAILYFANGRIPRRRRVLTGVFMLVLAVSFLVTALDLIWHGLNVPHWYNNRYSFLLSFLITAAADRELAERGGTRPWQLWLPAGIIAAASLVVFVGRTYDFVTWRSAVAAVLIAAAVCAALLLGRRYGQRRRLACLLAAAVLLVHVGELGANAALSLEPLTQTSADRTAFAEYARNKGEAFALVDTGGALVRTESPSSFDMDRCEPMLFGYDGLSHYGSVLSQKSLEFLDRLGLDRYEDLWIAYGDGVTAAADSFLGVRYIVSEALGKAYRPAASAGGYTVYENPAALDIGWTADAAFAAPLPDTDSFSRIDALYAAAAPEVGAAIFTPAEIVSVETENFAVDGTRYARLEETPATVTYTLRAEADGAMYAELEIPDYPGVMVFSNDTFLTMFGSAQRNGTLYLGTFSAGDTVVVRIQASSDLTLDRAVFASESMTALETYRAALAAGGCALTKLSASHYTGRFTTGVSDTLLVFTMPFDTAWSVTLDGERADAFEVQDCLMALAVTPGEHTVELRYTPRGLVPGAILSCAALAACAAVYIGTRKKRG